MCKLNANTTIPDSVLRHALIYVGGRTSWLFSMHGTVLFVDEVPVSTADFATDASNEIGAAFYRQDSFYANWALDFPGLADAHINAKELHIVCLTAECRVS